MVPDNEPMNWKEWATHEVIIHRTGILARAYTLIEKVRKAERPADYERTTIESGNFRTPWGLAKRLKPYGHRGVLTEIFSPFYSELEIKVD